MQAGQLEILHGQLLNLPRIRHLLRHRQGRHDLQVYWDAVGGGSIPNDLGALYLKAIDKQRDIIKEQVAREAGFKEYDSRLKHAVDDEIAQLAASIGAFLVELRHYDCAAALQSFALDIDRRIFDNMSTRVRTRRNTSRR